MEYKYKGHAIMEVLGKPKEHVEKAVDLLIKKISDEKLLNISEVQKHSVEKVPDSETLFSTIFEFEIEFKDNEALFLFLLNYMPSSLEIYEPESLNLDLHSFNSLLTELLGTFHEFDKFVKTKVEENKLLNKKIDQLILNLVIVSLKDKPLSLEELEKITGIKKESLTPFLNLFVDRKILSFNEEKYSLVRK